MIRTICYLYDKTFESFDNRPYDTYEKAFQIACQKNKYRGGRYEVPPSSQVQKNQKYLHHFGRDVK